MKILQGVHLEGSAGAVGAASEVEQGEYGEDDAGCEGETPVYSITLETFGKARAVK